jgi:hypothetical protein
MHYKTIVLTLLEQQAELYEQLRSQRQLLMALESYARDLKTSHETWMETLCQAQPQSDPLQIRSEALERALQELVHRLPYASKQDEEGDLSLDEAMAYVQSHKSPA